MMSNTIVKLKEGMLIGVNPNSLYQQGTLYLLVKALDADVFLCLYTTNAGRHNQNTIVERIGWTGLFVDVRDFIIYQEL